MCTERFTQRPNMNIQSQDWNTLLQFSVLEKVDNQLEGLESPRLLPVRVLALKPPQRDWLDKVVWDVANILVLSSPPNSEKV